MKITAIILLSACLTASAKSGAQRVTLHVQNVPLEKVFSDLKRQTGYSFTYAESVMKGAKPVTIHVQNATLEEVLRLCFAGQPLAYTIIERNVVVKEKPTPASPNPSEGGEQKPPPPIDVTGRVTDSTGTPLAGASVQVRGTNLGTRTDANGNFTIRGIDENAVLEISFSGYKNVVLRANNSVALSSIIMKVDVKATDEVIINTGYQQLKPNEVTGSVVVITKEQLDKRIASDILTKLEGITNGLVFNKDPGTGSNSLRIRGESTIFGYTEPLIVLDNFPYDGDINDINPNDVESVTVLKDAAAASIYGVQAANGVIVITTKKGKTNQPFRLEINANTTIVEKPDLFYPPLISSSEFIDFEQFFFHRGAYNSTLTNSSFPVVSPVVEILNNQRLGLISSSDADAMIDAYRQVDWRDDFLKHLYRNEVSQQYQLGISGSGHKTSYYISTGFDKKLEGLIGNESKRFTINGFSSYRPIKNLEMQLGFGYVENSTSTGASENVPNLYPYMRLVDEGGNSLAIPQHRAGWEDTISNHGFFDWKYYPLNERDLHKLDKKSFTIRLSPTLKYTLAKGLALQAAFQYLRSSINNRDLYDERSYYIRNNLNRFAIVSNGNYTATNYPDGGELVIESSSLKSQSIRVQLDYSRKWAHHEVSAILGFNQKESILESNGSKFYGYDDETGSFIIPNLFNTYSTYPTGNSSIGDPGLSYGGILTRTRSTFFNSSYILKNRYTISVSGRLDGSNIFGVKTNDKIVPLWSAGLKWNISHEKFFTKSIQNIIKDMVFRATFGYNGNVSPEMVAVTTINYSGNAQYTGLRRAVISNNPNPELRWEKTAHFNIGLDFATKSNKITGSIEYFRKKGTDLIGDAPLDITTGIATLRGNFSDMRTTGWDINLRFNHFDKQFKWSTNLIFNTATEMVTRYDAPGPLLSLHSTFSTVKPRVGYPLSSVFSYKWGGLDPMNGNPRIYISDTLSSSYTTATLQQLQITDLTYSGRYNAPFAGAISNNISYKGLSLTFNITYKLGHFFRRGSISYQSFVNTGWQSGHRDISLRWTQPGDEQFTNVPSFQYPVSNSIRDEFYTRSDLLVERADHFRFQYANISYTLPNILTKKMKMQALSIYFYANNLNIIIWRANKRGIDPEYPYLKYPPSRTYSFGIKASI